MAEKNTLSILETIKNKLSKFDQKTEKPANMSEVTDEFEYIAPTIDLEANQNNGDKLPEGGGIPDLEFKEEEASPAPIENKEVLKGAPLETPAQEEVAEEEIEKSLFSSEDESEIKNPPLPKSNDSAPEELTQNAENNNLDLEEKNPTKAEEQPADSVKENTQEISLESPKENIQAEEPKINTEVKTEINTEVKEEDIQQEEATLDKSNSMENFLNEGDVGAQKEQPLNSEVQNSEIKEEAQIQVENKEVVNSQEQQPASQEQQKPVSELEDKLEDKLENKVEEKDDSKISKTNESEIVLQSLEEDLEPIDDLPDFAEDLDDLTPDLAEQKLEAILPVDKEDHLNESELENKEPEPVKEELVKEQQITETLTTEKPQESVVKEDKKETEQKQESVDDIETDYDSELDALERELEEQEKNLKETDSKKAVKEVEEDDKEELEEDIELELEKEFMGFSPSSDSAKNNASKDIKVDAPKDIKVDKVDVVKEQAASLEEEITEEIAEEITEDDLGLEEIDLEDELLNEEIPQDDAKAHNGSLEKMDTVSGKKILNENTIMQATDSIRRLVDAKNVVSGISNFAQSPALKDLAANMLEPRLERWLNENLATMVEEIVREEIKKILPKE